MAEIKTNPESSYGVGKLKGEKIGEKRGRLYVAINLLDVLDDVAIAEKTSFSLHEIEKLRKNNKKQ